MLYRIFFNGGSRYAVQLHERTVGSSFVDLVRQTVGYEVKLSLINCQITRRYDNNICYELTEAQMLECGRFTNYCKLNYNGGAGFLNNCMDIACTLNPTSGWDPITNPLKSASPHWVLNRDRAWNLWKQLGYPVTEYPYYSSPDLGIYVAAPRV